MNFTLGVSESQSFRQESNEILCSFLKKNLWLLFGELVGEGWAGGPLRRLLEEPRRQGDGGVDENADGQRSFLLDALDSWVREATGISGFVI